jgi:hypothetical protein
MSPWEREDLAKELRIAGEKSEFTADLQFKVAEHWRRVNLWLGIPAASLAAVAGAAALASTAGRIPAGIIALIAAAMGAVLAFLNPAEEALKAAEAANDQRAIVARSKQLALRFRQGDISPAEVIAGIAELDEARHKVNKGSYPPSQRLYRETLARWDGRGYRSYHPSERWER